jgi:hypothetical protein
MSSNEDQRSLTSLAIEFWRLAKLHERAIADQPLDQHPRAVAQLRYSIARLVTILQENGIRLIAYEGQYYEPNLPVSVVNSDEVSGADKLVIDRTIEPTLVANGKVLSMGKVAVRAAEDG